MAARAFLTLTLATCALGIAASAQNISITPPASTPEGNSGQTNFEFTVSIDQAPAQDVTVNFSINNGSAVGSATGAPPADFANSVGAGGQVQVDGTTPVNNTITFPQGSVVSHVITVPVTGDTAFESDETFSVSLSNPTGGAGIGTGTATATILNDDNQPFISINDAPAVIEGNSGTRFATFPVTLSQISGQDVTFTYNTTVVDPLNAGDGTNGGPDFTPQNNQVGVIQAGTQSTSITVPIIGDTIDEADGQFLVNISNVTGADIANGQATGTIIDDDGPIVSVSDGQATEGDGQIVFRVQLSAPSPQPITITYRTGSSSAIAGSDYGTQGNPAEVTGTYTFPAFSGDPSTGAAPFVDIAIPVLDDNISEPSEIFNFTIISADNNAAITGPGARRQAIGTILDNDGSPNLTVTPPAGGVIEGNSSNTPAVFTISLSNPSSRTVTFRYTTVAGTATENQDYTGIQTARVGTIPAGQTSTTVSVNVIGDLIDEANETFGLRVFSVTPADVTVGNSSEQTAIATIIDDDGPTISVVPTNVIVNEGSNNSRTAAAFTVQLNNDSPQPVTVTYTLGGSGNNANEATRGQDYTSAAVTGKLTFPVGNTTQQVPVSIIGDNIKEADEVITLTLTNPNGGSLGNNSTGTITIRDDDATPTVSIVGPPATREGSSGGITNFVFRVSLDRASSSTITVNYTVNDGTAVAGTSPNNGDFSDPSANNPITFNPGTIGPQTIIVPVYADRLNEDDENFSVSLSGATNARIGVGIARATIVNDDALPSLSIRDNTGEQETGPPPPQGGQQGPRIEQFLVSLNAPSGKDVTFSYQTIGAAAGNSFTALSGIDFVSTQQQVTIPAGQTTPTQPVSVTIISDSLFENDETFGVVLSNVINATVTRGGATGKINDDDNAPNIKITAPTADNTAIEPYVDFPGGTPTNGRNAVFPVTLSAAAGVPITARYTISGGANPSAFNGDFLASANDQTRVFQTGIITFPLNGNGSTGTTQNIVLFPRGDDGDEADVENYVVNLTPINANLAAAADGTANSTIADRDPNFNNFDPDRGFESYGNTQGTIVTLTGNQFVTDNQSRIQAVRFTGPTGVALNANIINVTATTITCRLPAGAYASTITVVLTSGRVLNTTDPGSRRLFYAQPIVTDFNPTQGVPAVTAVTITGRHFKDPRNAVNAVFFNGLATTPQNADRGFTVVSDTEILAYVPRGASSGPITIGTVFGGTGPPSERTFTVNAFTTGSIRFVAADNSVVYENAQATIRKDNGQVLNPVKSFFIQLRPATQNNGNNTPIAPRRQVDVTVSLNAAEPVGASQVLPIIQLDTRQRLDGISLVRTNASNSFTFRIAAGRDPNLTIPVIVTYAGNDNAPPKAIGNLAGTTDPITGVTIPVVGSGVQLTLRTEITASNDTELYPNNEFQEVQFERLDIHTFETDTGTALRTTEDQSSPNNRASFAVNLANLDFPNPAPGVPNNNAVTDASKINIDARPIADVVLTVTSSNTNEGQLTYYVLVNGQKFYPEGANPQDQALQVIYSKSPTSPEYYRNPHFIEAVGQDDLAADGPQQYLVTITKSTSQDPEYNNIPLQLPFVFVNTDNEQNPRTGQGFLFSKPSLTTDENGAEDTFTTSLRTKPTGNVSITLTSTRVDEVLFVDPSNPDGPGLSSLTITYLASGVGNGKTSTFYQTPLPITVRGVDDSIRDGDQQVLITTTVIGSADPAYGSIDPPDLIDTNRDNESNGITVFPTTLSLNENATGTFSVRLNARPTQNVSLTLSSSDTTTATIVSANTLVFTPNNYNTPQTVTVRGVADGGFAQQRTATIITSAASSGDPNFNNLDVADVTVNVINNDSAFVVNVASDGLHTSESGTNDLFTVSLGQVPTSNVSIILSANPASEARLSRTSSGATPSLTLTFTPTNYATPQTVNVIGQDDTLADGDKPFTIIGRVSTSDPVFASQPFPSLSGINADNETGTGGTGGNASSTTFAANSTYTFSTPYAIGTAATSTIPVRSLFTTSATDFKIYRFDVANQKNNRILGQDFQLVPSTGSIQRGIGYVLQTGATAVTLKTPSAVQAYNGTGFAFVLTRNKDFVNQTSGQPNANNGLNFIGFPFNPAQFGSVSFASAMVQSGNDIYQSVSEAAAAGVMSDKLYTMNSKGVLTEVPSSNQVLRPYGAYFVRIYRDSVTLTFRSPSAN